MTPQKPDRQTTTPFLLRLFYRTNTFTPLTDFDPTTHPRLPPSLQIYTWQSCTLRELSTLLLTALPNLLPKPYAGTRITFRLVYGDMTGPQRPGTPARFISRDLGSVVVGAGMGGGAGEEEEEEGKGVEDVSEALKKLDGEPEKTLAEARFVIGDYVCCAIFPPGPDGSVHAAPAPLRDGFAGRGRDGNGYRGRGGRGDFRDYGDGGGGGVPQGEWRRGEAPPERERGGEWEFSGARRGPSGGGGSGGRGRGRGRW
ncbi:hypothetical protein CC80DRAFT_526589 [Byssothecium circinans]|uniref:Sin3-associated polypeptide Sap18 n=1 Tax=Byssothecium circinans TaxID=147558 RepID=A0A6A5TRC9_9PLEO|nr:hypothetical protein CC80DRAFT_526589 [Byssothecium circinans]